MIQATLAEQAYWELRRRIVSGEFSPGRRLLPRELAAMLDISQTPVKEALLLLERDGLVECPSRRGAAVRRFTAQEIQEIYRARALLECAAVEAGLREARAGGALLSSLGETLRMEAHQVEAGADGAELLRLDCDFHEALLSLAASTWVGQWHRTLLHQTQTACALAGARPEAKRMTREHAAILDALHEGDADAACAVLRAHLAADCAALLPELSG